MTGQPLPRVDNVLQIGGIQTGAIDYPNPAGGRSCRVAHINTGSGLRFTVNLDRGADIVDAHYNAFALAYLTPNGHVPPSEAFHDHDRWLRAWPGGLCTTCGPEHIGFPRQVDDRPTSLHGHASNTPAALLAVENPHPAATHRPDAPNRDMVLRTLVRDSRMFGPVLELHREIRCTLGEPVIRIRDTVVNAGDEPAHHNLLYHVNLGYPLVDEGASLVYAGRAWMLHSGVVDTPERERIEPLKTIPEAVAEHTGGGERCVMLEDPTPAAGKTDARIGLVNEKLNLGLALEYDLRQLPRLVNWQHFSPGGAFVTGLEPYAGTLVGLEQEPGKPGSTHRKPRMLKPGAKKRYELTLRVLPDRDACDALRQADGPLQPFN